MRTRSDPFVLQGIAAAIPAAAALVLDSQDAPARAGASLDKTDDKGDTSAEASRR
jgi:hypothetical protein